MTTKTELDICQVLTISTGHVTPDTGKMLDMAAKERTLLPSVVYSLDPYGWLVGVKTVSEHAESPLPPDLRACIDLADRNGCHWLLLDSDGDVVDDLEFHWW